MTLKEWVLEYVLVYKAVILKPGTVKSYEYAAGHIPEQLDFENLTVRDLQGIINTMISEGLAWSTISHTFTLISQALSQAQNYGLPEKSHLLKGVILPKKRKKRVSAFSASQQKLFLKQNNSLHREHFEFLLLTGLRIGELIGLKQKDVDIYGRTIHVQRNFYRGLYQTPKTPESDRIVPLSHRAWQIISKRLRLGEPEAPVFTGRFGGVLNYRSMLEAFKKTTAAAGLPDCGIHVLRHTFATELLRRGANIKVISELLGHRDIKVTCDIYSDVTLDMMSGAVQLLDAAAH